MYFRGMGRRLQHLLVGLLVLEKVLSVRVQKFPSNIRKRVALHKVAHVAKHLRHTHRLLGVLPVVEPSSVHNRGVKAVAAA